MSYIPPTLTPARLREIASMMRRLTHAENGDANDLERWAVGLDIAAPPPSTKITWLATGDGEAVAIDEANKRVLGYACRMTSGSLKFWKYSIWDQSYSTLEAAKSAFESRF